MVRLINGRWSDGTSSVSQQHELVVIGCLIRPAEGQEPVDSVILIFVLLVATNLLVFNNFHLVTNSHLLVFCSSISLTKATLFTSTFTADLQPAVVHKGLKISIADVPTAGRHLSYSQQHGQTTNLLVRRKQQQQW